MCCALRAEAQSKLTLVKEKAVKDLTQYNTEMKELERVIAHELYLKEHMTIKSGEKVSMGDSQEVGPSKTYFLIVCWCWFCQNETMITEVPAAVIKHHHMTACAWQMALLSACSSIRTEGAEEERFGRRVTGHFGWGVQEDSVSDRRGQPGPAGQHFYPGYVLLATPSQPLTAAKKTLSSWRLFH